MAKLRALLCAVLVCLSVPRRAQAQFLSPGPLAAAHSKWEGDDKCETCHSAGKGVPNAKCNACHDAIAKSQAAGRGLHGRKFKGQACVQCHSDHHGVNFALIRWDPKALNHADTGWPLRGDHASTRCSGCHKTKSYIGLSTACASCHEDPHESRFGANCLGCHNESDWNELSLGGFNHDLARFALRGAHQKVPCGECHMGTPPRYVGLEFSSCTSCHKDPHQGKLGSECEDCHSEADWHKVAFKAGAHRWLSLANGHARTPCARCHDRGTLAAPSRGRACVGCHAPVHEADFGERCERCHDVILWLGLSRKIGLAAHAETEYPLRGEHVAVRCSSCHVPELPVKERYRELPFERCDGCHDDPHEGRFANRDDGECGPCHSEQGFRPARFGVTLHATTAFPLVGNHVAVACAECHRQPEKAGKRLDFSGASQACASCHENPHGDQFEKEMRKNGCATCHTPAGWDIPRIDHGIWPLTGAHAAAPCGACHSPTEQDRKAGRGPSYHLAPRECEGCHADTHRGQFRLTAPQRTCGECHSTVEFKIANFDHERSTGYPLEGAHRPLACAKCHLSRTNREGGATTQYRLGYRRCRDCHADPHREASR